MTRITDTWLRHMERTLAKQKRREGKHEKRRKTPPKDSGQWK
jgi:hypothetical protein